jgi:hypothetical protein
LPRSELSDRWPLTSSNVQYPCRPDAVGVEVLVAVAVGVASGSGVSVGVDVAVGVGVGVGVGVPVPVAVGGGVVVAVAVAVGVGAADAIRSSISLSLKARLYTRHSSNCPSKCCTTPPSLIFAPNMNGAVDTLMWSNATVRVPSKSPSRYKTIVSAWPSNTAAT